MSIEQAKQSEAAGQEEQEQAQAAGQDDNDFPLGQACDLSGEGTCEACQ